MTVTVRYWAGARAAAGIEQEEVDASGTGSLGDLLDAIVRARPALGPVVPLCSVLVDGLAVSDPAAAAAPRDGAVVELLPPFAGG